MSGLVSHSSHTLDYCAVLRRPHQNAVKNLKSIKKGYSYLIIIPTTAPLRNKTFKTQKNREPSYLPLSRTNDTSVI